MKKGIVLILLIALVFIITSGYTTAVDTLLSQGKPATASSFQAGNEVAKGNDGSLTTRWAASGATFPQWWKVDLGASNSLNRVDINWYSSATRSFKYKIEVSTDNVTFTTVVDKTGNTTTGDTSDSFSATGRYVRITVTGASAGWASAYEFKVYNTSGGPTATPTPTSGPTSTPGPTATPTPTTPPAGKVLPGKIEAESYDAMSGVATETTSDTGGGLNVGWIDTNDWMDYNVTVNSVSNYRIDYRVASPNATGKVDFRVNSTTLASTTIPNTGGWQAWTTVTANVTLNAGTQTIRLLASVGGFNINWFQGTTTGPTPTPGPTATPSPTPTQGPTPPPGSTAQVIQTSQAGDRLATMPSLTFTNDDGSGLPTITIYSTQTYQTIIGFGGSLTESAAYVLNQAGATKRSQILNEYFTSGGSNYTLCRVHINSCDFSLGNWNYDNVAGDTSLTNFSISHDTQLIIPLIKDAKAISPSLKILASPWSPPGWMKQSGQMNGGGPLLTQYYGAWALYFSKYIKAYAAQGVNIWGITIQNEPMNAPSWEGCQYSTTQMRDFLKNNLGPQLKNDSATSAVNIMIFDHNKGEIVTWANGILSDGTAASYAWGTAFHWYGEDNFGNLTTVHNSYPSKHLVHTEGCQEGGPHLNEWAPAERYGHKMMGDLNNWTEGWVDWNIVLDQQGGPNHVNNFCSAPIHVDLNNGNNIIHNPSYYYITQISRYVKPGAVRIGWSSNVTGTEMTAFKNTDGKIAVIVMNNSANTINFKLKNGTEIIKPSIPAHSIATYIF